MIGRLAALALALSLAGCGSDVGGFIGTRSLNLCTDDYPVCDTTAGCVLTDSQYTQGMLPGTQQVIYRTNGPALLQVSLLFLDQRSPGSLTTIEWNEIGCGSQQEYSTMGQDLFMLAGSAQQIAEQRPVQTAGDHLIRLVSDATTSYQMVVATVTAP